MFDAIQDDDSFTDVIDLAKKVPRVLPNSAFMLRYGIIMYNACMTCSVLFFECVVVSLSLYCVVQSFSRVRRHFMRTRQTPSTGSAWDLPDLCRYVGLFHVHLPNTSKCCIKDM